LLQEVFLLNVATDIFILYTTCPITCNIECSVLVLNVVFPIHFDECIVSSLLQGFAFNVIILFETLECSIDEFDSFLNVDSVDGFANDQSTRAVFELLDLWEVAAGLERHREDFVTWFVEVHCHDVIASLAVSQLVVAKFVTINKFANMNTNEEFYKAFKGHPKDAIFFVFKG
jgi:hypothetical protein